MNELAASPTSVAVDLGGHGDHAAGEDAERLAQARGVEVLVGGERGDGHAVDSCSAGEAVEQGGDGRPGEPEPVRVGRRVVVRRVEDVEPRGRHERADLGEHRAAASSSGASAWAGPAPSISGTATPRSPVGGEPVEEQLEQPGVGALYVGLATTTRSAAPTCATRPATAGRPSRAARRRGRRGRRPGPARAAELAGDVHARRRACGEPAWGCRRRRRRGGALTRRPAAARRERHAAHVTAVGVRVLPQAALGQHRQHALAEPVGALEVRVRREHELVDADRVVLLDPVGDLLVAADQRGAGAAADQADAGPDVGVDLEVVLAAAVEVEHPALALGLAAAQPRLDLRDGLVVDAGEQPVGLGPGLLGGVAGDRVHPDAEPDLAALLLGEPPDPLRPSRRRPRAARPRSGRRRRAGRRRRRRPATSRRSRSRVPGRGPGPAWRPRPAGARPGTSTVSPAHRRADDRAGTRRSARSARPCRGSRRTSAARGSRRR